MDLGEPAERRDIGAKTPRRKMAVEWFDDAADSALAEPDTPLIDGLLDEGALSVCYGDSNSGKMFVLLDLGYHVATGLEWNGRRTKHGLVVYVAAEGGRKIKRRIAALKRRYLDDGVVCADEALFALVRYPIDLRSSDADLNELLALVGAAEAEKGEKCAWLIVDTLSRAIAGGDENSPVDMGRIVAAADKFRDKVGAHFTYVHHTGKDAARGARGHSLLRAATDTEIEIAPGALTVTKQRDIESGFSIGFELVDIAIGEDSDGHQIKSASVIWNPECGKKAPATGALKKPPKSMSLLMSVTRAAIEEAGAEIRPFSQGPIVKAAPEAAVRERFDARMAETEKPKAGDTPRKRADRQRNNFKNALDVALKREDVIAAKWSGERWLWLP